tara:strand:+ start:92 stop:787 length:696 start_codon:yes stop_codon:yes gene_type:complete
MKKLDVFRNRIKEYMKKPLVTTRDKPQMRPAEFQPPPPKIKPPTDTKDAGSGDHGSRHPLQPPPPAPDPKDQTQSHGSPLTGPKSRQRKPNPSGVQPPPPNTRMETVDIYKLPVANSLNEIRRVPSSERFAEGLIHILCFFTGIFHIGNCIIANEGRSQTWSKTKFGHVIIDKDSLKRLTFWEMVYRRGILASLANFYGLAFCGVGVYFLMTDEQERSWGDIVSKTIVVYV